MKVLIVLASNGRRGAEIEGLRLALELRKASIDAAAVALAPAKGSSVVEVDTLGMQPLAVATLGALRTRARQSDVVIAYGSSSLPACALALVGTGVPFIYRSIGDPAAWVRHRVHRWRTGILLRRAAHVVALWPDAAASIRKLYSIDANRLSVIPNARSPEEFRPPRGGERLDARARFRLPSDAAVVGCIGSVSAEKRVGLAVDAVAQLPGVHLLVVGDGPERPEIEVQARSVLRERATFTGVLEDVTPAYHAIDALLITSRTEGMPGVVLEAAMSGVPVVSTDVGGLRSMMDSGILGQLVPQDARPDDVAAAVEAVLDGPWKPASIERFTWPYVTSAWQHLLESNLC
jgi:glycosyltransferase involved in cell wall biosynthesis